MHKKLLVPIRVSSDRRGSATKGTKAFAEKGTDISKEAKEILREVKKRINKMHRLEASGKYRKGYFQIPWQELEGAIYRVVMERRAIAEKAEFYIKPITPLRKKIREVLIAHGVPIEVPILDLKNGLELFERGNFEVISEYPQNPEKIRTKIREIVKRMHSSGVTHNHLHRGNFVIDSNGNIKLIDLSKAKLFLRRPRTKKEFLERFSTDIFIAARGLAHLTRIERVTDNDVVGEAIDREAKLILEHYKIPTFNVTPKEILTSFLEISKREFGKEKKKKLRKDLNRELDKLF